MRGVAGGEGAEFTGGAERDRRRRGSGEGQRRRVYN